MKVGRIEIGAKASPSARFATVLYDTKIGDYARVGNLSLIMKGESIPPTPLGRRAGRACAGPLSGVFRKRFCDLAF